MGLQGNIGNMDRRIRLESRTVTVDGYGGQVESWSELATVWAQYTPQVMTGRNLAELSDQPQFLEKALFTIRFRQVPTDARIVYNGAVWKIIGMAEVGRRDRLQIAAVKTDSNLFD